MLTSLRAAVVLTIVSGLSAFAQPVVNAAVNAASYLTPPAQGSTPTPAPIAQGSIFVVFGTGMSGTNLVQASGFPLQTTMNGTSITVTPSGGQPVQALMVYTLAQQLAAILPSSTPVGPATLTVTYNGHTSGPLNIVVTKSVPGIFTNNAQGFGPGVAQIALSGTDIRRNLLTTPGTPGSVMILYGTGLGPISGADSNPPGAVDLRGSEQIGVTVGGKAAMVLYAGRAPQFPGEDQINIQLPQDVPLGCYTPAVVTVNGIPSNDFVLSTASALGSCVHPFGLSPQAEATLDSGGTVNIGVFAAVRGAVQTIIADGAGGLFETANASQVFSTLNLIVQNFHVTYYPAATGSCVVYDELSVPVSGIPLPDFTTIGSTELQPAASLLLSGPNNVTQGIIRAGGPGAGYLYVNIAAATSPLLGPGTWTLSADGGPDIAAFSAQTEFPANLTWNNRGTFLTNAPTSGVTLTWDGGATATQPNVNIFGNSSVFNPSDPSKNRGKSFSCIVPVSAKQFAVPAAVTNQLPLPGAGEIGNGELGISMGGGSQFNAKLTNGQPLDGSFFGFGEAFVNNGSSFAWK